MRFGIMSLQLEVLLPSGGAAADIVQHGADIDLARLVATLQAHGFDPIELSADLALFVPHVFAPATIERLAALQHETGLRYTVHLPLWSVEPSSPQPHVRQGALQALIDAVRVTWPLRPEVYVLHATGALAAEFFRMRLPDPLKAVLLDRFQRAAAASIEALLQATGIPSRALAVETIEFPLERTLALAEAYDLSICLDTGHLLAGFSGTTDLWDALERCLPRLAEVHLHDAPRAPSAAEPGYGSDHRPLGSGDLDVGRLLDRLAAAGFSGPLVFELELADARRSLEHIRRLRPALLPSR